MPRFTIEVDLNDGKRNAPPVEVEIPNNVDALADEVIIHGTPDHQPFFGVGHTIKIVRIA